MNRLQLLTLATLLLVSPLLAKEKPQKPSIQLQDDDDDSAQIMQDVTGMVNGVLAIGKDPHNGHTIIQGITAIILNFADIMTHILKKKEIELSTRGIQDEQISQELAQLKSSLLKTYAMLFVMHKNMVNT